MFVRIAAAAAVAVMITPACVMAQSYQRVAPRLPSGSAIPVVEAAPLGGTPSANGNNGSAQVLASLKGVMFVASDKEFAAGGVGEGTKPVDASRVPILDQSEFLSQISGFVGKPLTISDLEKIRAMTIEWQSQHGDPFVNVSIPPQNVTSGVVQIVVTQYWLGQVAVEGNHYFSQGVVKKLAGFKPGEPLMLNSVQSHMNQANQNPFLDVNAIFQPGSKPGEADMVLKAKDQFPVRVYAGYDNNGIPSLGLGEMFFGMNWGNVLGQGQVLSYQYTRTLTGDETSHSASYTMPISWDNQLQVFGSYQVAKPNNLPEIFRSKGTSAQVSLRYVHFFQQTGGLTQDVQLGYDFKTTNNNLDFFGYRVFSQRAQIHQFSVTYDGTLDDRLGQTAVQNIFVFSPGGMTDKNNTAVFETFVPGAKANYVYDRLSLTRTTRLPWDMSSISRGMLQLADHNLLDSEQLAGGGVGSVRGYYTDTALGSDGVILSQEFRAPPINLRTGLHNLDGHLQFGAFVDYANLWQVNAISTQDKSNALLSTGVDAALSMGSHLNIEWNLGWRLKSVQMEPKKGAFGNISLVVSF